MYNVEFNTPEIRKAFGEYDRAATITNFKVACAVGIVLMPAGFILDRFVYPNMVWKFLELRLICSVLIGAFLTTLLTAFGRKYYRIFGIVLFMLPASFIAWMIYATEGAASPYYAGLNLVLLVLALVLHWTFWESLVATCLVIILYPMVVIAHHGGIAHVTIGQFVNNLYFLSLTGIIVIIGSYFHSKTRFSEFASRYQLERSKQELETTNRRLVELDRLKSRFFANISHELRTPLTLLLAPLESLMHRSDRSVDNNVRELIVTMHANGMRLLKLINDLLDLIRLEAGRLDVKKEPLEVSDFIKGLASAVRQVAADKRIQLETRMDERIGAVLTDRDKLEKITLNLLFNALKFTPIGGQVWLRAEKQWAKAESETGSADVPPAVSGVARETSFQPTVSEEKSVEKAARRETPPSTPPARAPQREELVLIVSDTGVGIAEKNLPFVFDRFWQADNSSKRKFQGAGIGLALVKELVEMLGGAVTVQSEEGKGATFTVRLPYRKAEAPQKSRPAEVGGDAPPALDHRQTGPVVPEVSEEWFANLYRRAELFPAVASTRGAVKPVTLAGRRPVVLVADDEPDMRRFIRAELDDDYDVLEAVDGRQALEMAEQSLPNIILLDIMMPEMDGLDVCRALRQNNATASIPLILLTARADEETKFDALQLGANDFLAKPFSVTELHARIKNLIESHHYQRKLSKQNVALTSAIEQIKETEMQLVQSEKLASLGRLSAGIIHEINNPLNYTLTGLFALRNKSRQLAPKERGEYEEILNDVEEGVKRVRNIVSDLRTFTHPGGGVGEPVEVSDTVAASLRFLAGEWKDKVRVEKNLPANQVVWANRNKLIHVLVNLLQNAIDALQEKEFANGGAPTVWIEGRMDGDRSLIVIRDNGPGIDAKVVDKIFDPFFTTKEVGKGMGLGLSICYRIVQGYGGRISVKSELGKFCEFTLDFPVREPADKPEIEHGELLRL
jgi:signal transduction histidine kinase